MLYHLSVFLHLLGALIWVGGMLMLAVLVVPTARYVKRKWGDEVYRDVVARAGRIFRIVGWTGFFILITTGLFNVGFRYGSLAQGFAVSPTVHAKLGLAILSFILTLLHDAYFAPRFEKDPERYARISGILGRVAFLLSFTAFVLGFALSRGILR